MSIPIPVVNCIVTTVSDNGIAETIACAINVRSTDKSQILHIVT